jgi:hypothetical protein
MPQLTNPRQEALAQNLAMGKPQMAAYIEAGYKGKNQSAAFKACNVADVLVRKAELIRDRHEIERRAIDTAIDKEAITKGYIVTRLKYITDRAIRGTKPVYENGVVTSWLPSNSDNNAAVAALKVLAQMGGFLVDKIEIGQPGDFARLTDDELQRELVLVGESIGIAGAHIQKAIAGRIE